MDEITTNTNNRAMKQGLFCCVKGGVSACWIGMLCAVAIAVGTGCGGSAEQADAFGDLAQSLEQKNGNDPAYDLQTTVRVIYVLEQAVKEVKDFDEFARFLAGYDFDRVPKDVVEAQALLVPVLRELYDAGAAKEENESVWRAFQDFEGPVSMAAGGALALIEGDALTAAADFVKAGKSSISQASERHARDTKIANRIKNAERAYTEYLQASGQVFIKYMKEWDAFCVVRDEAYLSLHHGNYEQAVLHAEKALAIAPQDRESMLLRVFGGLMSAHLATSEAEMGQVEEPDKCDELLAEYMRLYPDYSAPALLLQGMSARMRGDLDEAILQFDESALQYPKQASRLLEMMDPYEGRGVFGASAESDFVLELYKSTMEGFGAFSPNFHKAEVYLEQGDLGAAQEEVRMHFFRRGEQVVQDYLPTDLVFCQTHIPEVVNSLFVEKPFMDIEVEEGGMMDAENALFVTLTNHSNRNLENVRLFLCVHFTDTYHDTYEVYRMPNSLNALGAYEQREFEEPVVVNFEYKGNAKRVLEDVVHIRGVLVTDDIVTWVDSDDFKLKRAQETLRTRGDVSDELRAFVNTATISAEEGYVYTTVTAEFDRGLVAFNPYVSLNELDLAEAVYPRERRVTAEKIEYAFRTTDGLEDLKFLHLSCDLGHVKIPLK